MLKNPQSIYLLKLVDNKIAYWQVPRETCFDLVVYLICGLKIMKKKNIRKCTKAFIPPLLLLQGYLPNHS